MTLRPSGPPIRTRPIPRKRLATDHNTVNLTPLTPSALARYGQHLYDCTRLTRGPNVVIEHADRPCSCGFDAALEAETHATA